MSIDIFELNIELAKEFGVELDADFWRHAETFGAVVDEVARHLADKDVETKHQNDDETLLNVIDTVAKITGTKRNLEENTKLSKLVPFWRRGRFWNRLRERYPLLPSRESATNDRMFRILGFEPIPFFLGVVGIAAFNTLQNPVLKYAFGIVGILGFLGFVAVFPMLITTFFVLPCKRIGDVAKLVTERRRRQTSVFQGDLTEVENELRKIFCRVLAAKPEKVTRNATLSGELKLS